VKRLLLLSLLLSSCSFFGSHTPVPNPDPNHTHADFAVWVNGEKLDFSGAEYMSGTSTDEQTHDEVDEYLDEYLHLHDEVGYVIHRHKPGLSLLEFLQSLGVIIREIPNERICLTFPQIEEEICEEDFHYFFVYTNDPYEGYARDLRSDYLFDDIDRILITNGSETTSEDIDAMHEQWMQMTNDACLYSKTCPWRGDPPAENCIADPEVPCVLGE